MKRAQRAGTALLAVIIALVLIEALVAGSLVIAAGELAATRGGRGVLAARLAATSALAATAHAWPEFAATALPPLAAVELDRSHVLPNGGANAYARIERLDIQRYIVTGRGTALDPDSAHAVLAELVQTVPRRPIFEFALAAVSAAGPVFVSDGALLAGEDPLAPPAPCDHEFRIESAGAPAPAVRAADPGLVVIEPGAIVQGSIAFDPAAAIGPATLLPDMLPFDVSDAADTHASGSVVPVPATRNGTCDILAPNNWGYPDDPAHPCHRYAPLIHAPDDLDIAGATGQGILIVDGNLTLHAGARFEGIIIANGDVEMEAGANLAGALRAGAGTVRIAGEIRFDRCAVLRALAHAPALNRTTPGAQRRRLPMW